MNTPRTKLPIRFKPGERQGTDGTFHHNINNSDYLIYLGTVASTWSYIEDAMLHIFADVLNISFPTNSAVRQLYYSIINSKTRSDIMKNALQLNPINMSKGAEYDEILDEYKAVGRIRNNYIHGLWLTHENGDIYIINDNEEEYALFGARQVTLKELSDYIDRMNSLLEKIRDLTIKSIRGKLNIQMHPEGSAE